jgi:hypothetical protein
LLQREAFRRNTKFNGSYPKSLYFLQTFAEIGILTERSKSYPGMRAWLTSQVNILPQQTIEKCLQTFTTKECAIKFDIEREI